MSAKWRMSVRASLSRTPLKFPNWKRSASCGFSYFHERETVLGGFASEELDLLLPKPLFIVSGSAVDVFLPKAQHAVNQSRQLGGHRGNGFRRTQPCAKARELSAEIAIAVTQRSRRHSQCCG